MRRYVIKPLFIWPYRNLIPGFVKVFVFEWVPSAVRFVVVKPLAIVVWRPARALLLSAVSNVL